jgi:hypothetical protein
VGMDGPAPSQLAAADQSSLQRRAMKFHGARFPVTPSYCGSLVAAACRHLQP